MVKKRFVIVATSVLAAITFSSVFAASTIHVKHAHHSVRHNQASTKSSAIDLNSANIKSLSGLKGIGPKKAKAIVVYRQQHGNFKSLADLAMVKGISKKSVDRLIKNNPNRLIINR